MDTVYTLPVYDGEITGHVGALLVAHRSLYLVDGDRCGVGYCVRDVGAIKDDRVDWRRVGPCGTIEEYRRHYVTYSPGQNQPMFEVWERTA